jgi:hypothetical protein
MYETNKLTASKLGEQVCLKLIEIIKFLFL